MPEKVKLVTLWIHWKQGDDLAHHLDRSQGNAVQGLREWADSLEEGARHVRELAGALEGHAVTIQADTHHIGIDVNPQILEKIKDLGGVCVEELDEEDEDEDFEDELTEQPE